jgi:hypothetical protein
MFWRDYTLADPQVVIFIHIGDKKMIFHTCKPISDFLLHIGEENEWYCTFVGPQVVFLTNAIKEKKWYAHLWFHD